ncbi:MAG: ABC transporter ATP-binding protein [Lachnotalea sp.]
MIKILKFCKRYFTGHIRELCVFGFAVIMSGIFTFWVPVITSHFIDFLVGGKEESQLFEYCMMFSGVTIGGLVIGYIVNRIYVKLSAIINQEMNKDIIRKAQQFGISELGEKDVSRIAQQINSDTQTVTGFCFEIIQNGITNILKLIIPIIVICLINYMIMLILVLLMVVYIICYKIFRKQIYKSAYELKENQTYYFSKIHEQLQKIKFIQTHGINDIFHKRMDTPFIEMLKTLLSLQRIQYIYSGLDTFTMSMGQILLFLVGGTLVIHGRMTIGIFTLISSYFSLSVNSIRYFFGIGKQIQNVKVSYERLQVFAKYKEQKNGGFKVETVNEISLFNVKFAYGDREILNDFNATFKMGTSYAIVGENGSGKTTLINMVIGLYDKYNGSIQYNGIDIKSIDILDLRKNKISVVEQDPELLNDSIYTNIDLYSAEPDPIRINTSMVEWFETDEDIGKINVIENSVNGNLSGGERQKIALVRALYKNPDVLILDEPTSAIDKSGRDFFTKKISEIKKNKIVIIVTHEPYIENMCDVVIQIN